MWGCGLVASDSGCGPMISSYVHDGKSLGFVKDGGVLDWLGNCFLPRQTLLHGIS